MTSVLKILFLLLFFMAASYADEEMGGYATDRLESEYKLLVPDTVKTKLWPHLVKSFKETDSKISSEFSVEYFKDTYFDNSERILLHHENGIRKRERLIPENPTHPKHGRVLIQIKLKSLRDDYRYEIKYPVIKNKSFISSNLDQQIEEKYKNDFLRRLRLLSVAPDDLKPILVINQKRSRVYLKTEGSPFLTVTFDETYSDVLFWKAELTEVEIELNEVAFTSANEEERKAMLRISSQIKEDLLKTFPDLKQNQTPKYNKIYDKLDEKVPMLPQILKIRSWFI